MNPANRVALNTGILYSRMLITMGVTLYSTRLVLHALGSVDYGIFNLLAGIILMLSFLNAAMSTSTQRYLSYHQGRKDPEMQKKVFASSFVLHLIIAVLIVAVLEIAGLFLLNGFLNIPPSRMESASTVYHFMSLTVFFTVIAVPFNGSLMAHENMFWVALVNIVEAFLKLGIAISLSYVVTDKLVTYGILTACITIVSFAMYALFCFKKYPECNFQKLRDTKMSLIKELGSFAGWNLFGALCGVGRTQGLALILNLFFGTVVNAAYGIANQVGSQLLFFSSTMLRSLNPQIMKSEGAGDRDRMLRLAMMASKFGFFLLATFAIPVIFEMETVLSFWLKEVPEYTVTFCRLVLIGALINQLTIGLQSANQAIGRIKYYMLITGGIILLNLPLAYVLLRFGFQPHSVLWGYCILETLACISRLIFLKKTANMSIQDYIISVFGKEVLPVFFSVITSIVFLKVYDGSNRFLITMPLSALVFLSSIYFFGLSQQEKAIIGGFILQIKSKVLRS